MKHEELEQIILSSVNHFFESTDRDSNHPTILYATKAGANNMIAFQDFGSEESIDAFNSMLRVFAAGNAESLGAVYEVWATLRTDFQGDAMDLPPDDRFEMVIVTVLSRDRKTVHMFKIMRVTDHVTLHPIHATNIIERHAELFKDVMWPEPKGGKN